MKFITNNQKLKLNNQIIAMVSILAKIGTFAVFSTMVLGRELASSATEEELDVAVEAQLRKMIEDLEDKVQDL